MTAAAKIKAAAGSGAHRPCRRRGIGLRIYEGGLQIFLECRAYRSQQILKSFVDAASPYRAAAAAIPSASRRPSRGGSRPGDQRAPVLFDHVYGARNPAKAKEFNNRDLWR
jgi:hypothetical protein